MDSIILCEGRVDTALIGQYLASISGWHYSKVSKSGANFLEEDRKQIINKYKRDDHWMYLWGVGGRKRFKSPFEKILEFNSLNKDTSFNNIVFIVDRDEEDEATIVAEFAGYIGNDELRKNEWLDVTYTDKFGHEYTVRMMLIIVPFDEEGALETVMINSLAEEDDEEIIPQCVKFIDGIKSEKYLKKRRDILKAKLSTLIAIIDPDRAVDSLVEIVEGIQWDRYRAVNQTFNKLLEL
ncbi:MAG: hypothetical protein GXY86_05665 [Firmicutes bacterium]|nr:hypothetical protein [Bacillota bacterium]